MSYFIWIFVWDPLFNASRSILVGNTFSMSVGILNFDVAVITCTAVTLASVSTVGVIWTDFFIGHCALISVTVALSFVSVFVSRLKYILNPWLRLSWIWKLLNRIPCKHRELQTVCTPVEQERYCIRDDLGLIRHHRKVSYAFFSKAPQNGLATRDYSVFWASNGTAPPYGYGTGEPCKYRKSQGNSTVGRQRERHK